MKVFNGNSKLMPKHHSKVINCEKKHHKSFFLLIAECNCWLFARKKKTERKPLKHVEKHFSVFSRLVKMCWFLYSGEIACQIHNMFLSKLSRVSSKLHVCLRELTCCLK